MKLTVDINTAAIMRRERGNVARAQAALDAQVLKDSNYFCPMDTGALMTSGVTGSVIGAGRVEWDAPYAREQYYEKPNKGKDRNPNASGKWFERAKALWVATWTRIAKNAYST